jgi:hypothetical protein
MGNFESQGITLSLHLQKLFAEEFEVKTILKIL